MPDSYFSNSRSATYHWNITQRNPDFFVQVNITKLSLRYESGNRRCVDGLNISGHCPSVKPEMFDMCYCQCSLPAVWNTGPECNLTITVIKQHGLINGSMHGFNATLTLVSTESTESSNASSITSTEESVKSTESTSSSTEESNHSLDESVKVVLPVTMAILVVLIIVLLLVLVARFKWFRKTNKNAMNGIASFTNSGLSQNDIITRTNLGRWGHDHLRVNDVVIERNVTPDQIKDRLQEQGYQNVKPNGITKQYEYAYAGTESLRGRQTQVMYESMSNDHTAPNTVTLVKHDQGVKLDEENYVRTKATDDRNLDHLEGDGVESTLPHASVGEDDQNKQEHNYQNVKAKVRIAKR